MAEIRFRLRDDAWPPQERALVRRLARSLGVMLVLLVVADALLLRDAPGRWGTVSLTVFLVAGVGFLLARRRVARARAQWASFAIVLDGDRLRRELAGARPLEIARGEVRSVEERAEGLVVLAEGRQLLAPRLLADYGACRAAIEAWRAG